jgi:hypothetical protein
MSVDSCRICFERSEKRLRFPPPAGYLRASAAALILAEANALKDLRFMPRKTKTKEPVQEKSLPAVAAMKFWSRFKHPPPMLAFTFPEGADCDEESLGVLTRLPEVSIDDDVVYSLKISLDQSKPLIWRRILIKSVSLEILHHILQLAMGWDDSHLHGFEVRKTRVPLVDDGAAVDESGISIAQLDVAKIRKFHYVYDFGDHWRHTITIEKSVAAQSLELYPQCLDGRGACPFEDIGGISCWSQLLAGVQDPEVVLEDHFAELVERLGQDFAPLRFDVATANSRLQRAFNKRARRKGQA